MPLTLSEIPEAEITPLVGQLLEIIRTQQDRIQQLEDEILRLKGLKTRPVIAPSPLERPPRPPREPGQKRSGSAKRSKPPNWSSPTKSSSRWPTCHPDRPSKVMKTSWFRIWRSTPRVTRYRRERWRFPTAEPAGPSARRCPDPGATSDPPCSFILHQYHHQHVTQPLLLEQLHQLGIDISAGQLNHILTEKKEVFHQEKAKCCRRDWRSPPTSGGRHRARHQGHNGFCTHIGNDLFAYFESTDSKSRLNFLEVSRTAHRLCDQRGGRGLLGTARIGGGVDRELDQGCDVVRRRGGLAGAPGRALGSPASGTCGSPPKGRCWGV